MHSRRSVISSEIYAPASWMLITLRGFKRISSRHYANLRWYSLHHFLTQWNYRQNYSDGIKLSPTELPTELFRRHLTVASTITDEVTNGNIPSVFHTFTDRFNDGYFPSVIVTSPTELKSVGIFQAGIFFFGAHVPSVKPSVNVFLFFRLIYRWNGESPTKVKPADVFRRWWRR